MTIGREADMGENIQMRLLFVFVYVLLCLAGGPSHRDRWDWGFMVAGALFIFWATG